MANSRPRGPAKRNPEAKALAKSAAPKNCAKAYWTKKMKRRLIVHVS